MLNVVNGFGVEAGKPLASSPRIAKIAFTGETTTGRLIMQYAAQNIIPVTLELGGKSPNVFFDDVAQERDAFYDKALEGFTMFALNQGEVCTCPSRALVQSSIYSDFVPDAVARVEKIKQGNPLDTETTMGAQASNDQLEKILSYLDIGRQEGAKVLTGGERNVLDGDLAEGYYVRADDLRGRQLDADLPGGDLRPGRLADELRRRGRRPRRSPTTRSTASAPACGPATARAPTGWAAASRPVASGRTATTSTRRTPRSVATSSRASAARTTR